MHFEAVRDYKKKFLSDLWVPASYSTFESVHMEDGSEGLAFTILSYFAWLSRGIDGIYEPRESEVSRLKRFCERTWLNARHSKPMDIGDLDQESKPETFPFEVTRRKTDG